MTATARRRTTRDRALARPGHRRPPRHRPPRAARAAAGSARRRRRRLRRPDRLGADADRGRRLRRRPARRPAAAAAGTGARRRRNPTTARSCHRPRRSAGAAASRRGRCSRTSGWPSPSDAAGGCRPTSSSACSAATAPTPRAAPACCAWAVRSRRGSSSCSRSCARASSGAPRPASTTRCPAWPSRPSCSTSWRRRPRAVVTALVGGLRAGAYDLTHRAVLVNFVARMRTDALRPLAAALGAPDDLPYSIAGLCHSLAELAADARRHARGADDLMAETTAADPAPARRAGVRRRARRARRGRRPPAPAELEPVAVGRRHVPPRRRARRRHGDLPEVRRPAPADGDRRRHARHRPRPAAARHPGDGQDVGQRAPGRGDQRRLDAARAGHRRHDRGVAALRLELRPPARRGPDRGGPRAEPGVPGDAHRAAGARRGADADAVGGAGRARHDPVREGAAGPRARHRGRGRAGLQPDRHGERPRPRHQRAVERAAPPVQHRRAAAAGDGGGGDGHRGPARRRARRRARPAGRADGGRRDPPRRDDLPRAARRASPTTVARASSSRAARCRRPRRSRSSPTGWRWPPTSATARCGPTDIAGGIVGAVVRDPLHDDVAWREYLEGVVRDRDGWGDFYDACRDLA